MTFTDQLILVVNAFSDATGLSLTVLSSRIFNDSKRLTALESGKSSVTLNSAERALQWFSQNWPDDLAWPSDVVRPAKQNIEINPHISGADDLAATKPPSPYLLPAPAP